MQKMSTNATEVNKTLPAGVPLTRFAKGINSAIASETSQYRVSTILPTTAKSPKPSPILEPCVAFRTVVAVVLDIDRDVKDLRRPSASPDEQDCSNNSDHTMDRSLHSGA